ncbi:hypothetical protein L208DRAFT_1110810, partial [Tricholoma matsutake]
LLYLPPYSLDLNPVEESFSIWKAYLRHNKAIIRDAEDPILILLEACSVIMAEMAEGWF